MEIRKSRISDLSRLLELYENARTFMRETGNPGQWGTTRPEPSLVEQDIENGDSYVCVENGKILGTFFFKVMEEPAYQKIYDGAWIAPPPYGVVHRIAADRAGRGVGSFCLNWAAAQAGGHLRIDTHRDNKVMQNVLKKNQFTYCGIIYLADGDERWAYERAGR